VYLLDVPTGKRGGDDLYEKVKIGEELSMRPPGEEVTTVG
jgi:hypothetical protein